MEEGEIGLRYNKNRYNKQILCIVIVVYIIQKQEQERTILKVMSKKMMNSIWKNELREIFLVFNI